MRLPETQDRTVPGIWAGQYPHISMPSSATLNSTSLWAMDQSIPASRCQTSTGCRPVRNCPDRASARCRYTPWLRLDGSCHASGNRKPRRRAGADKGMQAGFRHLATPGSGGWYRGDKSLNDFARKNDFEWISWKSLTWSSDLPLFRARGSLANHGNLLITKD